MTTPLRIRHVQIFPLAIPMRFAFEHAAATRDTADPIVVQVAAGAPYAHYAGYGETLARPYVTGETPTTVVDDIGRVFAPRLPEFRPGTYADALEFIEALPTQDDGRVITAARAAVELALLDLVGQVFRRRPADAAGWMGLPGFGPPGCCAAARYSGVAIGKTPGRLRTLLRLQRWYGLRDFKIKVGVEGWEQQLETAYRFLQRAIAEERVTLRADANGAWSLAQAQAAVATLERCGVCALEQPLPDAKDAELPQLAARTRCALIADESLLTAEDAKRLIRLNAIHVFNIRIAKNGGLLPSLRLARLALAAGLDVQLGCMVGETSILTAAGMAFLEACPKVRWTEGAFGRFLLRDDVVRNPLRFGRGGRIKLSAGFGLAIEIEEASLHRLAGEPVRRIHM